MKRIFILFVVLAANLILAGPALPCSLVSNGILWPTNEQKDVPLNAHIVANCYGSCEGITIALRENGQQKDIKLAKGEKVENDSGLNWFFFIPETKLEASAEYIITVATSYETKGTKFRTGTSDDTTPPVINIDKVSVKIDWAEDNKEVEFFGGGMCGPAEYTVEELSQSQWWDNWKDEVAYLPEHYNLTFNFQEAADENEFIIYDVSLVNADGSETSIGKYLYAYISPERIAGVSEGESKTYRFRVKDILGNALDEAIDINVDFNKSNSKYSISGGTGGGGSDGDGGGGGGGGDDGGGGGSGSGGGGEEPESSSSGCSLGASAGTNGSGIAIVSIMATMLGIILTKRRSMRDQVF